MPLTRTEAVALLLCDEIAAAADVAYTSTPATRVVSAAVTLQLVPMSVGAEAVTIAFQATWRLAVLGVAVSLVVGVLAGIAPAWAASRMDLVAALRGG